MKSDEYVNFCRGLDSAGTISGSAEAWTRLQRAEEMNLLHATLGLVTESTELADAVKKYVFYGKPLDQDNLLEEAGDVMWYLARLVDYLGVDFETVMETNRRKLEARYKGTTWNQDGALTRDTDNEMKELVKGTSPQV